MEPLRTPRIGHDLVDIARFGAVLARRAAGFQRRVFTAAEWEHAARRPDRDAVLAARFAGKEAVFKALQTGWGQGVAWRDAEIRGGGRSAPELVLSGRALEIAEALDVSLAISLSHTDGMASAVAYAHPRRLA